MRLQTTKRPYTDAIKILPRRGAWIFIKILSTKPIDHNPLLVLPTAAGKTIVFSHLIKELSSRNKRFLILAHRQELVSQAKDKLLKVWPSAPVGVLAASLKSYDTDAPILVASRDTLASQKRLDAVPCNAREKALSDYGRNSYAI